MTNWIRGNVSECRIVAFTRRPEERPSSYAASSAHARIRNRHPLREPMITTGLFDLAVHPLLYNDPVAVDGDDEPMQVKLETVLKCGAVDLRYQAAG